MTANAIARHLRRAGYEATAVHRDVGKTKKRKSGVRRKNPDNLTGTDTERNKP
jgi:hypothetical protein